MECTTQELTNFNFQINIFKYYSIKLIYIIYLFIKYYSIKNI